jgi:hypothetical protein
MPEKIDHIDFISIGIKKELADKYTRARWCKDIPKDEAEDQGWNVTMSEWMDAPDVIMDCEVTLEEIGAHFCKEYGVEHITFWAEDSMLGLYEDGSFNYHEEY